jgi:acetyltransferase-like isoleucine patch superfamily enzyme
MIVNDGGFQMHCEMQSDLPGRINILGDGVRIEIGKNVQAYPELSLNLGPGCRLVVGDRCHLGALTTDARDRGFIEIEEDTAFVHSTALNMPEPSTIIIGHGCLFGTETAIFTSDYHSILEMGSGRRLNHARDVVVGPQVWMGVRATILKGTRIGPQSVIGFGAVVSGEIPANCVAAGNPARIVKRNVRWTHALLG